MPCRAPPLACAYALALPLALAACDDPEPVEAQFALRAGDAIFVGLVADGDEVEAYACDGTADAVTLGAWLRGPHDGGTFDLEHATQGVRLAGTFDDAALHATLTLADGTELAVDGARAAGDDGLYLAISADYKGGWVLIGGDQRGSVIHRPTGTLASGASFNPAVSPTVMVEGVTLTPTRLLTPTHAR